ncbi:MAG: RIP metalloprotease RseP [Gammaproteobacteria bacterium]|nr:RIP metalloprotease RseP [Gammaproteobacteria bacterium]
MDFLQHLFAFIFALGVLITFHEYGHFWVARRYDVKILRFSVGFGRPLWKRYFGKDKSELVVAALPLGGYVKMLDEREGTVLPHEVDRAFNRKPIGQRFMIVLAGPLFNFLFAILAYWIMYMIGLSGLKPIIGIVTPGSIAEEAGLKPGHEIIAIDSHKTATWTMVVDALINDVIEGGKVQFTVRDSQASEYALIIDLKDVSIDDLAEQGILERVGVQPVQIKAPAVIGSLNTGLAAEKAGFKTGDRIIAVDGKSISDWGEWVEFIQAHPEENLTVDIMRNEEHLVLLLRPDKKETDDGRIIGFIGAANKPPLTLFAKESYAVFPAFIKAIERTWTMSWVTLRMLGKIITGKASYKNLSGPISIAQYAGDSAENGIAAFLWFLGIVSVSLGVLNLLPIPLLDGGHLMYYLIEFVKGSPVSETVQMLGQQIGLALLLGLMILVFYNDIMRLIG